MYLGQLREFERCNSPRKKYSKNIGCQAKKNNENDFITHRHLMQTGSHLHKKTEFD